MEVIIDGKKFVKFEKGKNVINGIKYEHLSFKYDPSYKSNAKYKVLLIWSDGYMMIHEELMSIKEIYETEWQMGVQAFPIARDMYEEKSKKAKGKKL